MAMKLDLRSLVGLGLTGASAFDVLGNSRDLQSAQNRALEAARNSLGGFTGGFNTEALPSVIGDPEGRGFRLNLDPDSQRLAQLLGGFGANQSGQLGTGFDPATLGLSGPGGLDELLSRGADLGGRSFSDLLAQLQTGFQRPLQNTAFLGAADQLREASIGGDVARQRQLDLLRAQALPFETRAFDALQNRQFGTGQFGSSGGALQTEAFSRGLGEADLSRQLAAAQEGRAFQSNAFGLASGFANLGTGLRTTEEQLLNDAFGRFSTLQGMNADLNERRFARSAFAPLQIDAARLGNIGTAQGIRGGLQNQALDLFRAGLEGSRAGADVRSQAAATQAAITGSPNFGLGAAQQANLLSQLGSTLLGDQSVSDVLGRLFGRGGGAAAGGLANLVGGAQPSIAAGIGSTSASGASALGALPAPALAELGGEAAGLSATAGAGGEVFPTSGIASTAGAGAGGLASLVAGAQPGIAAGIAGTEAANLAALSALQAPTLAGTAGAAGGASGAAAGGAGAVGTTAAGLSAGLGIAALPALIMAFGGFANDRGSRENLAIRQSGMQSVTLNSGVRALALPDGTFIKNDERTRQQIRNRWGVIPTDEFFSWLATLPKERGAIRRLPQVNRTGRQVE